MEKLFKLLSDAQASLFVLFHKTWVYHWNVVGKDFQQLHTLFGGQYETIFEEIDRLSEHMRYLNVKPLSSLNRVLEVSKIKEASSSVNAEGMISDLLQSNIDFCDMMGKVSEEAEGQKSYATANLVQDLMESHGKFVWMLRSFSDTTSKKVQEEVEEVELEEEIIEENQEVQEIVEE
jgi:starvation-inducible DNA-binding protein